MNRGCGLTPAETRVALPTWHQCASSSKTVRWHLLHQKENQDTSLLVIFTSPERWTAVCFFTQQVGMVLHSQISLGCLSQGLHLHRELSLKTATRLLKARRGDA